MSAARTTFCSARTRRDLTCNRRAKWRCASGHELCGTHVATGHCTACGAALTIALTEGPEPLTT